MFLHVLWLFTPRGKGRVRQSSASVVFSEVSVYSDWAAITSCQELLVSISDSCFLGVPMKGPLSCLDNRLSDGKVRGLVALCSCCYLCPQPWICSCWRCPAWSRPQGYGAFCTSSVHHFNSVRFRLLLCRALYLSASCNHLGLGSEVSRSRVKLNRVCACFEVQPAVFLLKDHPAIQWNEPVHWVVISSKMSVSPYRINTLGLSREKQCFLRCLAPCHLFPLTSTAEIFPQLPAN